MTDQDQASAEVHHLTITVAHHGDREYYTLARVMPASGGALADWNESVVPDVSHEVPPAALFAAALDAPSSTAKTQVPSDLCVTLDARSADGKVIDRRTITVDTADQLLDGHFDERLAAARKNMAAFYDRYVRDPSRV